MLGRSGDGGHSCLILGSKGNASNMFFFFFSLAFIYLFIFYCGEKYMTLNLPS